ncbi:MAG: hypothetical protein JWN04_878, partial [Myxococcaceae bacterium]|nr:hypothetical protein [Myxococcaceae bacterium]
NFVPLLEDHCAVAATRLRAFMARLEQPEPIKDLPDTGKRSFIAGCLSSLGAIEVRRAGPECLQIADRLESFSPLFAMNADNLRASFYASQGNLQRSQHYRERMEVHAVQLGSAWQVETWAPCDSIHVSLRTNDASKLKRAGQELGRLSASIPSLRQQERHARAAYLVLRRKYEQAILLLEADDAPEMVGWARARGVLARAYNGLGKHERAREICLDALRGLTEDDLSYVVMYLNIQLELSLAEAGMGHFGVAKNQLDRLLARHAPDGSHVTLGLLHEARVRVAVRAREFPEAREHLSKMESHYRSTDVATLIELIAPLERELERSEHPDGLGAEDDSPGERAPHALLRVELLLSDPGLSPVTVRAQKGIQLALELSSADEGFIVLADSHGEPASYLGEAAPPPELVLWAEQSILDAGVDEQTVMTAEVDSVVDSNYKVVGPMRYCVVPLWARQGHEEQVVAALVLGFNQRVPRMPEPAVIRAIAQHLVS